MNLLQKTISSLVVLWLLSAGIAMAADKPDKKSGKVIVIKKEITIYSLDDVTRRIIEHHTGQVIGAASRQNNNKGKDDCKIYSIRLLTQSGRVQTFHIDSCTGEEVATSS